MSLVGQFANQLSYLKSNQLNVSNNKYQNGGTIAVWGNTSSGGDTGQVAGINGVVSIYPNTFSFAALKEDGTVAVWGNINTGGNTGNAAGTAGGNTAENVNNLAQTLKVT